MIENSIFWLYELIKKKIAPMYYKSKSIKPLWGDLENLSNWEPPNNLQVVELTGKKIVIFTCSNGPWIQICYILSKLLMAAGARVLLIIDAKDNMYLKKNKNYIEWSVLHFKNFGIDVEILLSDNKIDLNVNSISALDIKEAIDEMCWLGRVDNIASMPFEILKTMPARIMQRKNSRYEISKKLKLCNSDLCLTINGYNLNNKEFLNECLERNIPILCVESAGLKKMIYEWNSDPWNKSKGNWKARFFVEKIDVEDNWFKNYVEKRKCPKGYGLGMSVQHVYESDQKLLDKIIGAKDGGNKIVLLATNCVWDTAVIGNNKFFNGICDWVNFTLSKLLDHDNIKIILRVHPHEDVWGGPIKIKNIIDKNILENKNVIFVDSKDSANSYQLAEFVDYGIVYSTTFGIEMAAMGIPVIHCGKVHYDGIGFSNEPNDIFEYINLLEKIINKNDQIFSNRKLAVSYLYWLNNKGFIDFPIDFENWRHDLKKTMHPIDFLPFFNVFKEVII